MDIDSNCAENLRACLQNEKNDSPVHIICADAISYDFGQKYDLVTMVGSSVEESGREESIITKAFSLVKEDGAFYLQILQNGKNFDVEQWAARNQAVIAKQVIDDSYDIHCEYYRIQHFSV